MDADEYEKRLEKIRKCLRLSKSAEANEAAAAMRQAQKLMQELGIDESELGLEATIDELVITKHPMGANRYLLTLVAVIKEIFGVDAIFETGNGVAFKRANIRYFGPKSRCMVAAYSHRVVDRAIGNAWKDHKDDFHELPGARLSFKLSFLASIRDKIELMTTTPAEQAAIKRKQQSMYKGLVDINAKPMPEIVDRAANIGEVAAKGFDLHRPMDAAPVVRRLK